MSIDEDALLRRRQTAEALTQVGYKISEATLAGMACGRQIGPPFSYFGRFPVYRWGDALSWAKARLTPPRRYTSEIDAHRTRDPLA